MDILGANLYNNFIRRYRHVSGGSGDYAQEQRVSVADSRMFPSTAEILPQTARSIDGKFHENKNPCRQGLVMPSVQF